MPKERTPPPKPGVPFVTASSPPASSKFFTFDLLPEMVSGGPQGPRVYLYFIYYQATREQLALEQSDPFCKGLVAKINLQLYLQCKPKLDEVRREIRAHRDREAPYDNRHVLVGIDVLENFWAKICTILEAQSHCLRDAIGTFSSDTRRIIFTRDWRCLSSYDSDKKCIGWCLELNPATWTEDCEIFQQILYGKNLVSEGSLLLLSGLQHVPNTRYIFLSWNEAEKIATVFRVRSDLVLFSFQQQAVLTPRTIFFGQKEGARAQVADLVLGHAAEAAAQATSARRNSG